MRVCVCVCREVLGSLLFVRLPELLGLCRYFAKAVLSSPSLSFVSDAGVGEPSLCACAFFSFIGLVLYLPLLASRSGGSGILVRRGSTTFAMTLATMLSYLLVLFACDGPMLWKPSVPISQTALITGGNAGIGLATAKTLAANGAHVLLACRSTSRCQQAAAEVSAYAGGGGVATAVGASLDLNDLGSVRRFASHLSRSRKTLDVLILNAGFAGGRSDGRPTLTAQGTELSLGAMHVGHALLAEQLLPMLEATGGSGPSRVITIASEASHLAPPLHPSLFVGKGEGDLRGEVRQPPMRCTRCTLRSLHSPHSLIRSLCARDR